MSKQNLDNYFREIKALNLFFQNGKILSKYLNNEGIFKISIN